MFRRKGRGVELTVPGRLLHESVARSFEVIRGGLERIETYLDPDLVTLVCPASIAHGWLEPRMVVVCREHPSLQPIISVDESARYIDEMDVDIAITREPLRQPGICEEVLLRDALCMVASGTVAQGAPLLCLESDMTSQLAGPFIRSQFAGARKAAIYDDARLLLDAACRGRGVALVSQLLAHDALLQGRLVRLEGYPALPAGSVWISRMGGESRSPLVRAVFDSLVRLAQLQV